MEAIIKVARLSYHVALLPSLAAARTALRRASAANEDLARGWIDKSNHQEAAWLGAAPEDVAALAKAADTLPAALAARMGAWDELIVAPALARGAALWGEVLDAHRVALHLPSMPELRRRATWADAGDELNHDRLHAGRLEQAWRVAHRRVVVGAVPRVRVVVQQIDAYDQRASVLQARGLAGALLHHALVTGGYACEIWATGTTTLSGNNAAFWGYRVAESNRPLQASVAGTALVWPGAARCILLPLEVLVRAHVDINYGVCSHLEQHGALLQHLGWTSTHDKTLIVPRSVRDAASAIAWANAQAGELQAIARGAA